jgi:hypothetical protein
MSQGSLESKKLIGEVKVPWNICLENRKDKWPIFTTFTINKCKGQTVPPSGKAEVQARYVEFGTEDSFYNADGTLNERVNKVKNKITEGIISQIKKSKEKIGFLTVTVVEGYGIETLAAKQDF